MVSLLSVANLRITPDLLFDEITENSLHYWEMDWLRVTSKQEEGEKAIICRF
jgi:hypothetical protein